jgi:hypothetical protein
MDGTGLHFNVGARFAMPVGSSLNTYSPDHAMNQLIAPLDTQELAAALERAERPDDLDGFPGGWSASASCGSKIAPRHQIIPPDPEFRPNHTKISNV